MEMSLVGCSQAKIAKTTISDIQNLGFCNSELSSLGQKQQIWFNLSKNFRNTRIQSAAKAIRAVGSVAANTVLVEERCVPQDGVQLFVGLPMDAVSDCNAVNHARAINAGLKALKLLGCEGVEVPVWWGIVEKEAGKYDWSGYLALAKMVEDVGLKLRVSLCFHASKELQIPLPLWISKIGEAQPDIYFANRFGDLYKGCLSFGADELPVLDGRSPMQVYQRFLESFRSSFSAYMGSTITDISVGLGPNGELGYPSCSAKPGQNLGAGEFQCYDKHMLNNLKQHAQETGNFNWGFNGPHDAPSCYESPSFNSFFKENGGSWETPYGDFFLSWYSSQLTSHGERLLSLTSSIFNNSSVNLSAKIPLLHPWYKMRSHPSELTAGFYNTDARDGYDAIAEVFAKNSCRMVLPGLELSDEKQPQRLLCSPALLISQIKKACRKHGVKVYGENLKILGNSDGLDQIRQNLEGDDVRVDLFTYQRMGAYFFSPEHFPTFSEFVRNLDQPELLCDDMPEEEGAWISLPTVSESVQNIQLQEA